MLSARPQKKVVQIYCFLLTMQRKQRKSTLLRARAVRRLSDVYYEPGNQSRCHKSVWRNFVYPEYGICYRTYLSYVRASDEPPVRPRYVQLELFSCEPE